MKLRNHPDRYWLLLAPNLLFALDAGLTLWGQPAGVWSGEVSPNEMNQIGAYLLGMHPLVFAGASVGYAVLFSAAILVGPRWLAVYCFVGLMLAHGHGANTWIRYAHAMGSLEFLMGDSSSLYAVVGTVSILGYLRVRGKGGVGVELELVETKSKSET